MNQWPTASQKCLTEKAPNEWMCVCALSTSPFFFLLYCTILSWSHTRATTTFRSLAKKRVFTFSFRNNWCGAPEAHGWWYNIILIKLASSLTTTRNIYYTVPWQEKIDRMIDLNTENEEQRRASVQFRQSEIKIYLMFCAFGGPAAATYSQLQKDWRGFGISESKRKIRK